MTEQDLISAPEQNAAVASLQVEPLSSLASGVAITLAARLLILGGSLLAHAIETSGGVALHELTPKEASLEEAFMDLTREDVEFKAAELEDEEAAA